MQQSPHTPVLLSPDVFLSPFPAPGPWPAPGQCDPELTPVTIRHQLDPGHLGDTSLLLASSKIIMIIMIRDGSEV